jgi:hypothetical protein
MAATGWLAAYGLDSLGGGLYEWRLVRRAGRSQGRDGWARGKVRAAIRFGSDMSTFWAGRLGCLCAHTHRAPRQLHEKYISLSISGRQAQTRRLRLVLRDTKLWALRQSQECHSARERPQFGVSREELTWARRRTV